MLISNFKSTQKHDKCLFISQGIRYYRVRWKGFGEEEDTWEPEENLFDCKSVLEQYWKRSRKNKKTKVEKRNNNNNNVFTAELEIYICFYKTTRIVDF